MASSRDIQLIPEYWACPFPSVKIMSMSESKSCRNGILSIFMQYRKRKAPKGAFLKGYDSAVLHFNDRPYRTPCMSLFRGLLNKVMTTAKATNTRPIVENTSVYLVRPSAAVSVSPESPCPPVREAMMPPA